MRALFPLLALLLSLPLLGQERNFRDLFVSPWQACNQQEKESVAQLAAYRAGQLDSAAFDHSLSQWGEACGSTEPLLSIQLLRRLEVFGQLSPSFDLKKYLITYYRFLKQLEEAPMLFPHIYRYLELKETWSEALRDQKDWPLQEALLLRALAEKSPAGLMAVFRRKAFYRDSLAQDIKASLENEGSNLVVHFDLAYQQQWYQSRLGEYFRSSPGLGLGFSAGSPKHQFILNASFNYLRNNRDLRLYLDDSTYFTRSRVHMGFGMGYSAQLWQNRWSELRAGALLSFEVLFTEAQQFVGTQGEMSTITINSASLAPFIEYGLHTRKQQQLGLRFRYHLVDFNRQGRARSNLRGNYSSVGLFYRW